MRWLAPVPALIAGPAYAEVFFTLAQAQSQMFPGELLSQVEVALDDAQAAAIRQASGIELRNREPKLWRASGGGWFFLDQVLGKHEQITFALALDASGAVIGLEILEYREHWGSEVRNARWRAQFKGRSAGALPEFGRDIANISGATLSCRHVTDGVKRLLATHAELSRGA